MADEYYVDHVMYVIGLGEGSVQGGAIVYDLVEIGPPNEGIGLLQWTWGRSFDILKDIYVALGNSWGGTVPPSGIKSAIENNQRWDSHKWYQGTADSVWVRKFLALPKARNVQSDKKKVETQRYLDKLLSQGVTDLRARAFCADVMNQYGDGGASGYNSNDSSLDKAFNNTQMTYYNRRKQCYDYLKTCDFSKKPPVSYETSGSTGSVSPPKGDSNGGQPKPPSEGADQLTNVINAMNKLVNEKLKTKVYKSGQFYMNKFIKLTQNLANTYIISPLFDIKGLLPDIPDDLINGKDKDKDKGKENENSNTVGKYNFPLNDTYRGFQLTGQMYGMSRNGGITFHDGVDFGTTWYTGRKVIAVADGEVIAKGFDGGSGLYAYFVILVNGHQMMYQEYSVSGQTFKKNIGDKVTKGEHLADLTDGSHLHFGVLAKGKDWARDGLPNYENNNGTWLDPISFLTNGKCKGDVMSGNGSCFL